MGDIHPVQGLRATSRNILWSTIKVNEACNLAPTRPMTKVRLSTDSPHQIVIPRRTPEYQYPWFRFHCASLLFSMLDAACGDTSRGPQTWQPSPSQQTFLASLLGGCVHFFILLFFRHGPMQYVTKKSHLLSSRWIVLSEVCPACCVSRSRLLFTGFKK